MSALMARVAKLDHDQVYWGLGDPVPLEELKPGDRVFGDPALKDALPEGVVYVERDCDLPPGRYQLSAPSADHPFWHFVPLDARRARLVPDAPNAERALYELALDLYKRDHHLPPYLLDWALWWETTIDAPHRGDKPLAALAALVALTKGAG